MTITIRKLHLAIAVLVVALIAPATAVATHIFTDVPDGAFYADPVEWAFNNQITTGKSSTKFAPSDAVTRGESVTFLQRYDDNIVQPAVAALSTAQPFAVSALETNVAGLTGAPAAYVTVSVNAAVDGHVTINSTAIFETSSFVTCVIVEANNIPPAGISASHESIQSLDPSSDVGSLSGTRMFSIAAGASVDYVLACEENVVGGKIFARNLTALFTPAA